MPKKPLPRIASVSVGEQPFTLQVTWNNGKESTIDVSGMIENFKFYTPLLESPELFAQVRVGEFGTDISWSDDLDMAATTLWRLAQEQSGVTMTAADFHQWRTRHDYTLDEAAAALGISRRMVAYYDHGDKPIPRVVALATRAFEQNKYPSWQQG